MMSSKKIHYSRNDGFVKNSVPFSFKNNANRYFLKICLLIIQMVVITSCDLFTSVEDACDATPVETHLIKVEYEKKDWKERISNVMKDPSAKLHICNEHFASSDSSGIEVYASIEQLNRIEATSVYINSDTMSHMTKKEMYADPATGNYFDYAFNNIESYPIPCRGDNDYPCGDHEYDGTDELSADGYLMTTCKFKKIDPIPTGGHWGGSGKTHNFNITVNSACYSDNPHSDPRYSQNRKYPGRGNILHELGHAYGMVHTDGSEPFISCMQGNTDYPTAYDVALLRYFYPPEEGGEGQEYTNLAVSTLSRPTINGKYKKRYIDANRNKASNNASTYNPVRLKGSSTIVSNPDDTESQSPKFYFAWFNNGTETIDSPECIINGIVLESKDGEESLVLHTWRMAHMPAESQDQFMERVTIDPEEYAELDKSKDYQITFYLDYAGSVDERYEDDNTFSYDIDLQ